MDLTDQRTEYRRTLIRRMSMEMSRQRPGFIEDDQYPVVFLSDRPLTPLESLERFTAEMTRAMRELTGD